MLEALIVAMGKNRVIGKDNDLPWRLSRDMRSFRLLTLGSAVVMGRKTYESIAAKIGGPLPGRLNIVLSHGNAIEHPEVKTARDLAAARAFAASHEKLFYIGGAQVYQEAFPVVARLHVTHVHGEHEGDVFFPECDLSLWKIVRTEEWPSDEKNSAAATYCEYHRL